MPPPRTGSVESLRRADGSTYFRARIRLADDSRERVDVPEKYSTPAGGKTAKERAELYALAVQEREDEGGEQGPLLVAKRARLAEAAKKSDPRHGETADTWHERYLAHCIERGLSTVGDKRYRWGKWISPSIGAKPIAKVTRSEIEDIRDALDKAIRAYEKEGPGPGRLAWKTAANVWGELTVSFGEAQRSKRRDLRVVEVDPTHGVQPPETGGSKSKVYPYPAEALAVFGCEDIPLDWRELHAVAAYTYLRPGELHVLTWGDVDLEDQKIRITKAWDYKGKRIKSTKTDESREIPIEPNLLPLLARLRKEAVRAAEGDASAVRAALVVPLLSRMNHDDVAEFTRQHFEHAKCVRPRLYARGSAERRLVFRSWRDAGITWSIVRGDDVVRVQRRAGHKLIATTMRYVVEAENRGATFGVPFPPLPPALLDPKTDAPGGSGGGGVQAKVWAKSRSALLRAAEKAANAVRTKGLEPLQELPRQNLKAAGRRETRPFLLVFALSPAARSRGKSPFRDTYPDRVTPCPSG
jgi:integrase